MSDQCIIYGRCAIPNDGMRCEDRECFSPREDKQCTDPQVTCKKRNGVTCEAKEVCSGNAYHIDLPAEEPLKPDVKYGADGKAEPAVEYTEFGVGLKRGKPGDILAGWEEPEPPKGDQMYYQISTVCDEVKKMLLEKNEAYGNSAAEPVRVFSKADPLEQINVRIDDKLSRIMKGQEYPGDDTELDLIGYLILKRAVKRQRDEPI